VYVCVCGCVHISGVCVCVLSVGRITPVCDQGRMDVYLCVRVCVCVGVCAHVCTLSLSLLMSGGDKHTHTHTHTRAITTSFPCFLMVGTPVRTASGVEGDEWTMRCVNTDGNYGQMME
jgi:hypothetical protein